MDFKDPTLTKIKQESEDFNEDVPDFVKIEPGEIKDLALNKFEFESSGNVKIESGEVKDLSNNSSAVLKQEMDFDMKVNSLNDLPMNKFEFVSTGEVSFPNTDIKQEMDIDIKENYLKIEDHFEKENSKANGTTTDSTNRKSLRCELCGTVCHSIDSYSLHMMYQHTGEQPFKCDKCDKAFKTEEELACHTKEHTELIPLNGTEAVKLTTLDLLPDTSKKMYQRTYNLFLKWQADQNAKSFSENTMMAYFDGLAKVFKSSTLWTQYSMLRTTLSIYNNIDIAEYLKLKAFLKRQADGYEPKKSKMFTSNDIDNFIETAPDDVYLATKVALIMGMMGACKRHELHQMKTTNFNDLCSAVLVTIPDAKTKIVRSFTVAGHYYEIYKKYADLRPQNANGLWFFVNYEKGKCTVQRMGLNKLGAMGKDIAKYLKLPNPELYTGHCFRRSSTTVPVDAGGQVTTLKRHGGWKLSPVVEGCTDESKKNSSDSSDSGSSSGHDSGSDSDLVSRPTTKKKKMHLDVQSRQICLNVYNNLQMQNEHLQVEHEEDGMEDVIKETAYLTEIPYSMICQIVREGVPKEKSRSDCDKPRKKINRSST